MSKRKKHAGGRPPTEDPHSIHIATRINEAEWAVISKAAKKTDRKVAEILRSGALALAENLLKRA